MTRQNQVLRVWIGREKREDNYTSFISFKGKTHTKVTNTRIRRAAREFATLHLIEVLRPEVPQSTRTEIQHELL